MAQAFLKSVANYVFENYKDNIEKLCIVLPNKRGALFLKKYLGEAFSKTIWLPAIISTEELIEELSGLKTLEEIDLLCHLYESYKNCYGSDAEPFDSFAKWGQLILQDFNEIDRYLADSEQLYENLKDIKVIENWSLGEENLSEHQSQYLQFMNSLGAIYKHFSGFLLSKGWAYQGLAYKQAVLNLQKNDFGNQFHKLIFCGFNALNAAEQRIFNFYYQQKTAELLWDADEYYLNDENQEAGLFLRNNFKVFGQVDPSFVENHFKAPKEITIVSVPRQIGQAQVVKQKMEELIASKVSPDRVAIVLANEKLLWPVLQQLPPEVEHVNITMEYPLKYTSTYSFIDFLIQLQINFSKQQRANKTIYHKDLVGLLRQPVFSSYAKGKGLAIDTSRILHQIASRNISFLTANNLKELFGENLQGIAPLLTPATSVKDFCQRIFDLLQTCVAFFLELRDNLASLELEYLQILLKNFTRLMDVLDTYPHFNDLHSFKQLYLQVVGNSTAPFIGEPLKGLQIMGVLETRTLDFEHLILVNVNEGVLPSGKSINSFIPNDLKRAFGLPLYLEKDAIYAYHFYRLLQRAADITITYDSETDSFGKGEKSRFVTQLQLELNRFNPDIKISETIAFASGKEEINSPAISVQKNADTLHNILQKATQAGEYHALSPSALITFKDCALKFYYRYGARLKETEEVEESAEANTFGSILHLSLEKLYQGFLGQALTEKIIQQQLPEVDRVVNESFLFFFDNNAPAGKSLLQEEVIKVYVKKLLNSDLKLIRELSFKKQSISLLKLEEEFTGAFDLNINGLRTKLYLKGKIDRLDSINGKVRIIDYKSSVKQSDKFVFAGFELLFQDKNYNKQLQLLLYAWLLHKNNFCEPEKMLPCIVPFKEFSDEPKCLFGPDKKPLVLTHDFLNEFEDNLKRFVGVVFDDSVPFSQTSDKTICEYCPYNLICQINA